MALSKRVPQKFTSIHTEGRQSSFNQSPSWSLTYVSLKVTFIAGIIDQGIELVVCEYLNVNRFFLRLRACFAEEGRL